MRVRRLTAMFVIIATFFTGSVVIAPEAMGGTYHLFGYGYADPNYRGYRTTLWTNGWVGNCDGAGYNFRISLTHVIDFGISSLQDATLGDKCNYVFMYDGFSRLCGNGRFLNFSYISLACQDRVRSMRFTYDTRLPWRSLHAQDQTLSAHAAGRSSN